MKQDRKTEEDRAEKDIRELQSSGNLKKVDSKVTRELKQFYEGKCLTRLETAKTIYKLSNDPKLKEQVTDHADYADYSEVVSASYYAMYYIVHAYLASVYSTKLDERVRGVHAITHKLVVYYLVKTKKLAQHLYEEYLKTLQTATALQNVDSFANESFEYADRYDKAREARERFTYRSSARVEEHHAKIALATAEEFINTIRQLMMKK